ncbi:unnamed protein product, partial [Phaeothamnion confervicola]
PWRLTGALAWAMNEEERSAAALRAHTTSERLRWAGDPWGVATRTCTWCHRGGQCRWATLRPPPTATPPSMRPLPPSPHWTARRASTSTTTATPAAQAEARTAATAICRRRSAAVVPPRRPPAPAPVPVTTGPGRRPSKTTARWTQCRCMRRSGAFPAPVRRSDPIGRPIPATWRRTLRYWRTCRRAPPSSTA